MKIISSFSVISLLTICLACDVSLAQNYPSKPITIVVPFSAGGAVDTTTRILANKLQVKLGQSIVVENIGGAAGSMAASKVASAKPDGYTLMMGTWGTHVANPLIYKLKYDVVRDFEPVALISSNPLIIIANNKVPATNLKELILWIRNNPGKVSQGTSGIGSVGHMGGILFQNEAKLNYQYIPYKGLAPAIQDLLGGNIDIMFDSPSTSLQYLKSGKIKALAVTSKRHIAKAPEILTTDEQGFPNVNIVTWSGIFLPAGTHKDIVMKLNSAIVECLKDASLKAELSEVGQDIYPRDQHSADFLRTLQLSDIEKWTPIIKSANINILEN